MPSKSSRQTLREWISGYVPRDELKRILGEANPRRNFESLVADTDFKTQVSQLVDRANIEGWIEQLLELVLAERAENREFVDAIGPIARWLRAGGDIDSSPGETSPLAKPRRFILVASVVALIATALIAAWPDGQDVQRAWLYVLTNEYVGEVIWQNKLVPVSPNAAFIPSRASRPPVTAVSADARIPNALSMTVEFQKSYPVELTTNDKRSFTTRGTHLIDVNFQLDAGFHGGKVRGINSISIKTSEGGTPVQLVQNPVQLGCELEMTCENHISVYLSPEPKIRETNIRNLRVAKFFQIEFLFDDGWEGAVVLEVGAAGNQAMNKALNDWGDQLLQRPE